jgi:cob(I)alamin adenosyltransferase
MSITTKTGDTGQTRLFSGEKISKNSPQTHAYGDIDELVSLLGVARAHCHEDIVHNGLMALQSQLFIVGSELATTPAKSAHLPQHITDRLVSEMDTQCQALEGRIVMPSTFVLPGSTVLAAHLDVARSVARRCERNIVSLHDAGLLENPLILVWMNRLSDYLWLLARDAEGSSSTLRARP